MASFSTFRLVDENFSFLGKNHTFKKAKPIGSTGIIDIYRNGSWKNSGYNIDEVPRIMLTEYSLSFGLWVSLMQAVFTSVGNAGSGDPYLTLYTGSPTGFQYVFPYLVNKGSIRGGINNSWADITSKEILGNAIGSAVETVKGVVDFFGKNIYPGWGSEQILRYSTTSRKKLTIKFPLYNTINSALTQKNFEFVSLFAFQNLKTRTSWMTYLPPKIYKIDSGAAGSVYIPAAYVQSFDVVSVGPLREITVGAGKMVLPDVYEVTIVFEELLPESSNIMEGALGGNKVEVIGSSIPQALDQSSKNRTSNIINDGQNVSIVTGGGSAVTPDKTNADDAAVQEAAKQLAETQGGADKATGANVKTDNEGIPLPTKPETNSETNPDEASPLIPPINKDEPPAKNEPPSTADNKAEQLENNTANSSRPGPESWKENSDLLLTPIGSDGSDPTPIPVIKSEVPPVSPDLPRSLTDEQVKVMADEIIKQGTITSSVGKDTPQLTEGDISAIQSRINDLNNKGTSGNTYNPGSSVADGLTPKNHGSEPGTITPSKSNPNFTDAVKDLDFDPLWAESSLPPEFRYVQIPEKTITLTSSPSPTTGVTASPLIPAQDTATAAEKLQYLKDIQSLTPKQLADIGFQDKVDSNGKVIPASTQLFQKMLEETKTVPMWEGSSLPPSYQGLQTPKGASTSTNDPKNPLPLPKK